MDMDHKPVLVKEVIRALNVKKLGRYIDATLGAGGHSTEILKAGGRVLAVDRDPQALKLGRQSLFKTLNQNKHGAEQACPDSVYIAVLAKFSQMPEVAKKYGFYHADGVLFDLGVSSMQFDTPGRGFSFQRDEPLDMRMNQDENILTAKDLINALREDQLFELFAKTTDQRLARVASRAVNRARAVKPIETTKELAGIIEKVATAKTKIHPATTIFMALRMVINNEVEELEKGLENARDVLKPGGRLAVISFHSGEDSIVKNFFKRGLSFQIINKKPILPSDREIEENPRSRSAKLRVAEKI